MLRLEPGPDALRVIAGGSWIVSEAGALSRLLKKLRLPAVQHARVDMSGIERLDTAGALLLQHLLTALRERGIVTELAGAKREHLGMLERVVRDYRPCDISPPPKNTLIRIVEESGEGVVQAMVTGAGFLSFLGALTVSVVHQVFRPRRWRITSVVVHVERVGLDAVPIVATISFLIGVVLAYQGTVQLKQLGAEVFVVDLVAISILRELGVLLTAIVIAGRSGSSFTAEIGTMKVNEEIDAMSVLGMSPVEVLVVPRVIALVVSLPLLTFLADMMGLFGGGLYSWVALDISPSTFVERVREGVAISNFWVGFVKAPAFAVLIALVGLLRGNGGDR